jgi:mono/diheme cytochrome c family protein
MNTKYATALLGLALCLAGCSGQSGVKFTLPKGDPDRGQEVFLHFRCHDCHRVRGVDLPLGEEPNQVMVELGRLEAQPHEYSDLVMAIINPSHRLAKGYTRTLVSTEGTSRMTVYNDVMTISQLVDVVAFLQAHYELRPYEQIHYPDYYGP